MPKLYSMSGSGNCYKPELTASFLGKPLEIVPVDLFAGETRSDAFRARNPIGKVPVLETGDGRYLAESNAIIHYIAHGSDLIPTDPFDHAHMLHWMFFEQYSHEPNIAVARFWWSLKPGGREEKAEHFPEWHKKGHAALKVMDDHLTDHSYFGGDAMSLADIALYAYTHVADEGGFDLSSYSSINKWLRKIEDRSGYIPMRPL